MERLVYQPDCGCQVYRIMHSKPNLYRVQYCSLHKSAPDMYEACKFAEYMIRNETWDFKPERDKALELLSEALAKVEEE